MAHLVDHGFDAITDLTLLAAHEIAAKTGLKYAYVGRRRKKRDFRRLWVVRINAAAREMGLTYSTMINGLKRAAVEVDRRVLADLAVRDQVGFTSLAKRAQAALAG